MKYFHNIFIKYFNIYLYIILSNILLSILLCLLTLNTYNQCYVPQF